MRHQVFIIFTNASQIKITPEKEALFMSEDKKGYIGIKFKFSILLIIVIILFGVFAGFKAGRMVYKDKQPEITAAYISGKINSISELTTAEMLYSGLVIYSEGEIPLLTKKGFSMRYTANIRAGIDFSKINVKITDKKVIVKLPEAEVQSIDIEPESIEFYDERYALFNWTDKKDVIDAMSVSKEDATAHANSEELVKKAYVRAGAVIKNVLEGSAKGREIIIE